MRAANLVALAALLASCSDAPAFRSRIVSHDVRVEVFPEERRLVVRDRFEVESGADGLSEIVLLVSDAMTVDSVTCEGREVRHRREPGFLHLELDPSLDRGAGLALDYSAHADDFLVRDESGLIEEVAVCGQVRAESSFSSHVHYYPVDARNDGAVTLSIDAPEGYGAVSGGRRIAYRAPPTFEDEARRPRLLPFGFAVARYRAHRIDTAGGLALTLHHRLGFPEANRHLRTAVQAAELFEELMGPLSWGSVAICQVEPVAGGAGVSLPGQILFSRDLLDGESLLLVDELSHQWNAYLAPLPNELAEGFATFSVALFLERLRGEGRYLREIRSHVRRFREAVRRAGDRAIADPGVYRTSAYREIAFCKTAAILHGLRGRLGDAAFFAGFRRVFETVRDPGTAYEDVRRAFEWSAREDLSEFFDAWLLRPGLPEIVLRWGNARVEAGHGIEVSLEQVQDAAPYEIDLDVAVRTAEHGVVRRRAALRHRAETSRWPLPSGAVGVGLDPNGTALFREVRK